MWFENAKWLSSLTSSWPWWNQRTSAKNKLGKGQIYAAGVNEEVTCP